MRKQNKIEITKQFSICSKFPVNMLDILNVTLKEIIGASPKKIEKRAKILVMSTEILLKIV